LQLDRHLSELARHYRLADNTVKSIEYLERAGQQAMQRCAHAEAIAVLTGAIDLIPRLPTTEDRIERELSLQLNVGPASFAIKGWGSPEAIQAYARAQELCGQLNNSREVFPTLYGPFFVHWLRGEFRTAYEAADDLMRPARLRATLRCYCTHTTLSAKPRILWVICRVDSPIWKKLFLCIIRRFIRD
jgi:hypothetical protein